MKNSKIFIVLIMLVNLFGCGKENVHEITYAVYPYLPDAEYYCELIEDRWNDIEPEISLKRCDWDCYTDEAPEGIDVIMYDAVTRDHLISEGWIQPVSLSDVKDAEDIYPFALEGLSVNDQLYGIPVFLCGNFLIYDMNDEELSNAQHITDLSDHSEIIVMNCDNPLNRPQYIIEAIADIKGEANPETDESAQEIMKLFDQLAVDACQKYDDPDVVKAYDAGIAQGYIGFSESMRLIEKRADHTRIKEISFSDKENIKRLYTDAAAVNAGVKGERYKKCIELMNIMADGAVLRDLSVQNEKPQYLLLARKSVYQDLAEEYPLYSELEKMASDDENHIILTP